MRARLGDAESAARLSERTRIEMAAAAGEMLAWTRAALAKGNPSESWTPDQLAALRQLAVQAEDVLTLVRRSLPGGSATEDKTIAAAFDASIQAAGAGPFVQAADRWIGNGGLLSRRPFNINPNRFAP